MIDFVTTSILQRAFPPHQSFQYVGTDISLRMPTHSGGNGLEESTACVARGTACEIVMQPGPITVCPWPLSVLSNKFGGQ